MSTEEGASKKVIPLTEISKHKSINDLWMAVNGKVYDITKFVDQHPGGEEVLLEHAGTDATAAFEDVGHSENAVEMLDEYYVGDGNPEELKVAEKKADVDLSEGGGNSNILLYIIAAAVLAVAYLYLKANKE